MVDAGHGGTEDGAHGPGGTLEKHVTLSVARRLKSALEARLGVRVILTRDADATVDLDERAAVANNNKADLFVSLHANASVRASATGAEVFYLSLEEYGDQAQRVAKGETEALPVFGGGTRDIEVILWEMAQARYIEASAALAKEVESALRERVPMSPRAIQQAPFRVLVGANMPAVLVEMGFITNADQEAAAHLRTVPRLDRAVARREHHALSRPDGQPGESRDGCARSPWRRHASLMARRARLARRDRSSRDRWGLVALVVVSSCVEWPDRYAARASHGRRQENHRDALFRVGGRACRSSASSAKLPFGETVLEQAQQIVEAQLAAGPAPLVSAIPPGTTLRALYLTERGDAFVDLSADRPNRAHRRRARRALHGLLDRQRAHGEPAGGQARADPHRGQGGRHAGRTRRPPASPAEKPEMGQDG